MIRFEKVCAVNFYVSKFKQNVSSNQNENQIMPSTIESGKKRKKLSKHSKQKRESHGNLNDGEDQNKPLSLNEPAVLTPIEK